LKARSEMGRLENPDRPAYHLRKQYFLRKTYMHLPSQCASFQRGSESWLLAAPIIEVIEMFRGQAFIPLQVLYSTAEMCRREGPRELLIDGDADLAVAFPQASSKISSVSVRGAKSGQDRMSGS
jgi:hypothetical protein